MPAYAMMPFRCCYDALRYAAFACLRRAIRLLQARHAKRGAMRYAMPYSIRQRHMMRQERHTIRALLPYDDCLMRRARYAAPCRCYAC